MKKLLLSVALVAASFASNAQIIVNGDFEAAISSPLAGVGQTLGWGTGIYSAESTSPFAGARSAKLETVNSPQINAAFGWGSDTITGLMLQTVNGVIANPANLSISFAYKYTRVASDTGVVIVNLYDTLAAGDADDVLLYQAFAEFTATTSAWGTMTIPVAANPEEPTGTVNQLFFAAVASNNAVASPGTTLWLDNITTGFAGVEENEVITASVYPNPATDVLNIKMNEEVASVVVTALDGKIVATESSTSVNISALNTGMYLYTITGVSGKVAKGNFVKN